VLFNSYQFILFFLPVTWLLYNFFFIKFNNKTAIYWLIFASLFFYCWWNPIYFFLIIGSIITNFVFGNLIFYKNKKIILILGIVFNLILIGYFKYYNFFIDIIEFSSNFELITKQIILPLGISFFTFQQITFLVDVHKKNVKDLNFRNYVIFVSFFPQLIAGPIVHHSQMLPQFGNSDWNEKKSKYLAIGLSIFIIGLFKKVVIADQISSFSSPIFFAADQSINISFLEAWFGVFCYSFQLYFDFSGYADMAIGLGYMFGIKLPINFNSPFKSTNIKDFWKTWHISLGTFIKNYLYYPITLFFSRFIMKRKTNKFINYFFIFVIPILITYLLVGIWHGSGVNFVLFGLLHGVYFIIYDILNKIQGSKIKNFFYNLGFIRYFLSCLTLFILVSISFVLFRAQTFESAVIIFSAMFKIDEILIPTLWYQFISNYFGQNIIEFIGLREGKLLYFYGIKQILIVISLFLICILMPNSNNIFNIFFPGIGNFDNKGIELVKIKWKPSLLWAIILSFVFLYTFMNLSSVSEFIYFQF